MHFDLLKNKIIVFINFNTIYEMLFDTPIKIINFTISINII